VILILAYNHFDLATSSHTMNIVIR